MIKKLILAAILPAMAFGMAKAETVLLEEDFNGDYTKSFPYVCDADGVDPASSIRSLFIGTNGVVQPWWLVRDYEGATDKSMASYAWMSEDVQANKWLISTGIEVPTEGFVLSFDAQSCVIRDASKVCDLKLFVTERLIDPHRLPTEPTMTWESVPYGNSLDELENDWTHYTFDLSEYAGKTIYLSFVNQNYDKDIIVIDNVKVSRNDMADMTVDHQQYTTADTETVNVKVNVLPEGGMDNWRLALVAGDNTMEESGAHLEQGAHEYNFALETKYDNELPFSVTLTADGQVPVVYKGSVTRLAFSPQRKVLLEDVTGVWCGNCPLGIYNIECMEEDEEMSEAVIPVSVHIPGAKPDYMVNEQYNAFMDITLAPTFVIDRREVLGPVNEDLEFDKTNPKSLAYHVLQATKRSTPLEISLSADWRIEGTDTIAINATAAVRSAMTLRNHNYAIGIVLTENNVGRNSPLWKQTNYFSGLSAEDLPSRMNGWCELPEDVRNVRFQDVARGVWGFYGLPNSLPNVLPIDEEVTFEYSFDIPNAEVRNSAGTLIANDICRANCVLVAYVIDTESNEIVNACKLPMSEQAEQKFTTKMLWAADVPVLGSDYLDGPTEYYNLQGIKVAHPEKGSIYIVRQGNRASKQVLK